MREISLSKTHNGQVGEENPPLTVYDTSGAYSDVDANIDIRQGLTALRQSWLEERDDTIIIGETSSEYGQSRLKDPELALHPIQPVLTK